MDSATDYNHSNSSAPSPSSELPELHNKLNNKDDLLRSSTQSNSKGVSLLIAASKESDGLKIKFKKMQPNGNDSEDDVEKKDEEPAEPSSKGKDKGSDGEEDDPPMAEGLSEEVYEVQRILKKTVDDNGIFYLVRWKGYGPEEDSWEPEENLVSASAAIKTFEDKEAEKASKKKGAKTAATKESSSRSSKRSSMSTPKEKDKKKDEGKRDSTSRSSAKPARNDSSESEPGPSDKDSDDEYDGGKEKKKRGGKDSKKGGKDFTGKAPKKVVTKAEMKSFDGVKKREEFISHRSRWLMDSDESSGDEKDKEAKEKTKKEEVDSDVEEKKAKPKEREKEKEKPKEKEKSKEKERETEKKEEKTSSRKEKERESRKRKAGASDDDEKPDQHTPQAVPDKKQQQENGASEESERKKKRFEHLEAANETANLGSSSRLTNIKLKVSDKPEPVGVTEISGQKLVIVRVKGNLHLAEFEDVNTLVPAELSRFLWSRVL